MNRPWLPRIGATNGRVIGRYIRHAIMRALINRVAVKRFDDLRKSKLNALQTYGIDKTMFTRWQNILGSRISPVVMDVGGKIELRYLDVTGEKESQKSK